MPSFIAYTSKSFGGMRTHTETDRIALYSIVTLISNKTSGAVASFDHGACTHTSNKLSKRATSNVIQDNVTLFQMNVEGPEKAKIDILQILVYIHEVITISPTKII